VSGENGHTGRASDGRRTLIVEPIEVLAVGLEQILVRNGVKVVGIASHGQEALRLTVTTRPAIVVVDLDLPDVSGIRAGVDIIRTRPGTKVAILSDGRDAEVAGRAREAGLHGHISLRASAFEISRSIDLMLKGEPRILAHLAASPEAADPDEPWFVAKQLTDREREVLRLLAVGLRNDRIAELLFLSPHTVRTHVQNIRTKLGVRSRLEAAVLAIRSGLADPGAEAQSA
jgi:NarL family two-component system response regulator LiaR